MPERCVSYKSDLEREPEPHQAMVCDLGPGLTAVLGGLLAGASRHSSGAPAHHDSRGANIPGIRLPQTQCGARGPPASAEANHEV